MKEYLSASTKPIIICGPCSAESYSQMQVCANDVAKAGVGWFRAGIWKPRTRPNSFEGIGEEGLLWLKEIKEQFPLKVCTEVASPYHLELCLKYGIDAIWIGARTCANPFSVQEIANSLQGIKDISVLVKNPPIPNVSTWLGSLERIEKAGCEDLIAIHRGFELGNNGIYRQSPDWRIPLELKRLRKDLKIICDPSHIAGKRELVKEISQCALSIGFDGLMIETHPNPPQAQTDKSQQLYSSTLKDFIAQLSFPSLLEKKNESLTLYRQEINDIDQKLCALLGERMQMSKKIAKIKLENNMSVFQLSRWQEVLNNMIQQGKDYELSEDFIKEIYTLIHQESIRVQTRYSKEK
ncbi:MAG: bifunctional 3-deoxy-7-phosphoheptulonate synthase/chorismate mutase type II [Bacteroidota bacterium]|nr:bifunctional 3-deoxy-7-phosphoheptulonate synthase/chorismate mutase type II [Bacteroidota bacterium]